MLTDIKYKNLIIIVFATIKIKNKNLFYSLRAENISCFISSERIHNDDVENEENIVNFSFTSIKNNLITFGKKLVFPLKILRRETIYPVLNFFLFQERLPFSLSFYLEF